MVGSRGERGEGEEGEEEEEEAAGGFRSAGEEGRGEGLQAAEVSLGNGAVAVESGGSESEKACSSLRVARKQCSWGELLSS